MAAAGKHFGKFTILRELGRGGMGLVYLARDNDLGREVALKMLLSTDNSALETERFRREARAAAKLKHPNIVPVYETGTEGGRAYFTMEFVKGKSLENGLMDLDLRRRLEIVRDVARGLHYAHSLGVVHRDIKPANILLADDGRPVVMDFGLAKQLGDARNLTVSGTIMGTPNFMSPEQAMGDPGAIDARSDVFSLGAVMYFLLTDKLPFDKGDTVKTVLAVLRDPALPPRRHVAAIPRDVETICLKALSKKPAGRFQSAEEFAADIDRHLSGAAIVARPPSTIEQIGSFARRHPAVAVGIVAFWIFGIGLFFQRAASLKRDQQAAVDAAKHAEETAAAARRAKAAEWVLAGREQLDAAERCMMTVGRGEDLRKSLYRAVQAFGKATDEDALCAEGFSGQGRALRLMGQREEAVARLTRAVTLAPGLSEAWYERGLLRLDQFIERKNAALSEPGFAGEPSFNARLAREHQLSATDDLARAAALPAPTGRDWMPLHALAALAFLAGDLPKARAGLDSVIEKSPFRDDALALRAYIRLLGAPPDAKGAIEDLDLAVQANALSASLRNLRGVAKGRAGDAKGSLAEYDGAIALDAGFLPARLNRSSARLEAADSVGAEEDAAAVLAIEKDNLPALRARGESRIAQGHFADAEEDFTHAVGLAPGAHALRVRRAAVLRLSGKFQQAAEDATIALKSNDPDIRVGAAGELVDARFAEATDRTQQETLVQVETVLATAAPLSADEILRLLDGFKKAKHKRAGEAMVRHFLKLYPGDSRTSTVEADLMNLMRDPR